MNLKTILSITFVLAVGGAAVVWTLRNVEPAAPAADAHGHGHGHGHGHDDHEEAERGPHGGRLLEDGDFAIELLIHEPGTPPVFHAFASESGEKISPADVELTVVLERFGGRKDAIGFDVVNDRLVGDTIVHEPHSFVVDVLARHDGERHRWVFESLEGRTTISRQASEQAGVEIATAGPMSIADTLRAYGQVRINEDRIKRVVPRYPGVVKEFRKRLGDAVEVGDVLAVVESNESLRTYEVRSAMAGTIVQKHVNLGEYVPEGHAIYMIADLSTVWVDLNIHRDDFGKTAIGQSVALSTADGESVSIGSIDYFPPVGLERSQTMLARMTVPNADGALHPGLFITGDITLGTSTAAVAVPTEALQTFRDWDVVILTDGTNFQVQPVELGSGDGRSMEIISGLEAGERYVSKGSFLIKADILKAGATHDH